MTIVSEDETPFIYLSRTIVIFFNKLASLSKKVNHKLIKKKHHVFS